MKKSLIVLCMTCALALVVRAGDGEAKPEGEAPKKPALTAEQKAFKKEMAAKYDTNKDGKLSKEERTAMSAEDKAKWEKEFPPRKKTESEHKNSHPDTETK